ncbi:beta-ig-h3 fasciclin [Moniliophthora roreri]|nr:beta-ig-h3 fasciclin [Moniliophthora roreri]
MLTKAFSTTIINGTTRTHPTGTSVGLHSEKIVLGVEPTSRLKDALESDKDIFGAGIPPNWAIDLESSKSDRRSTVYLYSRPVHSPSTMAVVYHCVYFTAFEPY